jgi:hypothetical protein
MSSVMERCAHGMEQDWCYLCRIESSGTDPRAAWGLDTWDDEGDPEDRIGPMTPSRAGYLRFLCSEFGDTFDATLTDGESSIVLDSFLAEPMSESQARTLVFLSQLVGAEPEDDLTYGQARSKIRRLVAHRGLKSALKSA